MGRRSASCLCHGEFPTKGYDHPESFNYARGAVLHRDLSTVYPVNPRDAQGIWEYIARSWCDCNEGDNVRLHPWAGETNIASSGPESPFESVEGYANYSFLKTPRWKDNPMEVGPLAQLLVSYGASHADMKELWGRHWANWAWLWTRCSAHRAGPQRGLDAALAMIWLQEYYGHLADRTLDRR